MSRSNGDDRTLTLPARSHELGQPSALRLDRPGGRARGSSRRRCARASTCARALWSGTQTTAVSPQLACGPVAKTSRGRETAAETRPGGVHTRRMEKRDARAPGFERRFDREARVVDRAAKRRLIAFTDEMPFRNARNRLNDPLARCSDCLVWGNAHRQTRRPCRIRRSEFFRGEFTKRARPIRFHRFLLILG